jgi:hypothetical protein
MEASTLPYLSVECGMVGENPRKSTHDETSFRDPITKTLNGNAIIEAVLRSNDINIGLGNFYFTLHILKYSFNASFFSKKYRSQYYTFKFGLVFWCKWKKFNYESYYICFSRKEYQQSVAS